MNSESFRKHAHELVDWIADYYEHLEGQPVKSPVSPGDILSQLPQEAPTEGEDFEHIFQDFEQVIMPGMTHWQHPSFFAYFNANGSFPSLLGEFLTAALGAQCMIWDTSPAAAELEERVMEWLKNMMGLPNAWFGVIQDTASTATLCAILSAREKKTNYGINDSGFAEQPIFRVYCSGHAHSSVDKAVKIAGIGSANLVKVPVDADFSMNPRELELLIEKDLEAGFVPLCVVAALGTTSSLAFDPLEEVASVGQKYGAWVHVDAAYAGTAAMLPECAWINKGVEKADSYVFNPHKWMFVNFDCSAYFVRDKGALIRTFEILPEYLKTENEAATNNYRDWGIQLGRRFRALKLWFVLRSYGVKGLQEKVRCHLELAKWFEEQLVSSGQFEILAPTKLNLISFRYVDPACSQEKLNALNKKLMEVINASGKAYFTHTKLNGIFTLRVCIGQTNVEKRHVDALWTLIQHTLTTLV